MSKFKTATEILDARADYTKYASKVMKNTSNKVYLPLVNKILEIVNRIKSNE